MRDKVLQVCSYYMGTNLYENLFEKFTNKDILHDILYFCAKQTVIERDLPDNFIISQPYNPMDRAVFKLKHKKVYEDIKGKLNMDDYYMSHAHSLMSNGYISYLLKKEYNIPYIVAVRNTDLFVFFRYTPWVRKIGRDIMNEAANVIFISPAYRDITVSKYVNPEDRDKIYKKSLVIPNGIGDYFLENKFNNKKLEDNEIKLIFVSRYIDDRNKNVRTIIKSCEKLLDEGIKVKLTLVGKFKRESSRSKYERNFIKLVDFTGEEGIKRELDKNDIFVMPSKRETFGLVYVEAMSQGLPVIYTKGQGFDGHFPEGHVGYHVVYNNVDEISFKIKKIMKNYENMSSNASKEADKFNWDNISDVYIDIYNSIRNS